MKILSALVSFLFVVPLFFNVSAFAANIEDGAFLADKNSFAYRLYLNSSYKNTIKEPRGYGSYNDIYKGSLDLYYGLTEDITLAFQGIYNYNGTEDRKGVQKANLVSFIRAADDVFFFDVLLGMSLGGILDAEMEAKVTGTVGGDTEEKISPRNYSYGMYGVIAGGRFGMKATPNLTMAILFEATHRFSQDDTIDAEVDATGLRHQSLPVTGTKFKAKGTFKPLTDYYTQIAFSYKAADKIYVNTKFGYQYYAEKHLKEARVDSASANAIDEGVITQLVAQGRLNDSWYEFSFGISGIYTITNYLQVGPYYEYMSGKNETGALQTKQRMEYGLRINGAF
ncbi:MAG: hypothetical protein LBP51_06890 [Deferribacteraceae bacterium]|jgi:hypothetical protein|nr:hypothetical protein [Deferribacteraceae bacterium]